MKMTLKMEMMTLPRDKVGLFGDIGNRLNEYLQKYNQIRYDNLIYYDSGKKIRYL